MKGVVLILAMVLLLPVVYAAPAGFMTVGSDVTDCRAVNASTILAGYVSTQGHYTPNQPAVSTDYPNVLCVPDNFAFNPFGGPGNVDFKYAIFNNPLINGSNHVSVHNSTNTNFTGYVDIGAQYCRYSTTGCTVDESCIFKMANPDNSQAADCNVANYPMTNNFVGSLCCKIGEICWDGIDNDLDGYMDCADSDCNGITEFPPNGPVQECTNGFTLQSSPMNTSFCVIGYDYTTNTTIFNATCLGEWPNAPAPQIPYYCGFGLSDDPTIDPIGACCPADKAPAWNGRAWECLATDACGISAAYCSWDITLNEAGWISEEYYGNQFDWCNSQVPNLFSPGLQNDPRSTGCCLIPKYGELDYYTDEDNVKIWG